MGAFDFYAQVDIGFYAQRNTHTEPFPLCHLSLSANIPANRDTGQIMRLRVCLDAGIEITVHGVKAAWKGNCMTLDGTLLRALGIIFGI